MHRQATLPGEVRRRVAERGLPRPGRSHHDQATAHTSDGAVQESLDGGTLTTTSDHEPSVGAAPAPAPVKSRAHYATQPPRNALINA
ncbi:hypothetical protein [Micromonospora sp. WMMD1082]|uniref:hypothetical protein n=1 Tax=Micromonospora sp. WMMD1082 TaxID=3016104 RepID=UPI0024160B72|nr:hypothetical protein [Micromonospora sp. WMMD1082]MDG4795697.1 hypothetical protein [Micromonospora sp. WMMD1082]